MFGNSYSAMRIIADNGRLKFDTTNISLTIQNLVSLLFLIIVNFMLFDSNFCFVFVFVLIGIHSMQGWTATKRHGFIKKRLQKFQDTENLFRKNLQLKAVC